MAIKLKLNPNGGHRMVEIGAVESRLTLLGYKLQKIRDDTSGATTIRIKHQSMLVAQQSGENEGTAYEKAVHQVISRMTIEQRYSFFEPWK